MTRTFSLAIAALIIATAAASAQNQRVLRDVCLGDARAYCSMVQPGGGRLLICLDRNRTKLTDACRAALPTSEAIKARIGG